MMETQLLKDPQTFPSEEVLEAALGAVYPVYGRLMDTVAGYGPVAEWRYYNDGKAWLCKATHKKKTVFWLSVWEGYFKTSFFFTEKHLERIAALDIDQTITDVFFRQKPAGKLLPMLFDVSRNEQLPDLLKVIELKMTLK